MILSCIDSRTSAELIFDQGLGDVFSVRIAGNIIISSIAFGKYWRNKPLAFSF
jgi:carbonic anhydrase